MGQCDPDRNDRRYPYPLVVGGISGHSNTRSLDMGDLLIAVIRKELAAAGML